MPHVSRQWNTKASPIISSAAKGPKQVGKQKKLIETHSLLISSKQVKSNPFNSLNSANSSIDITNSRHEHNPKSREYTPLNIQQTPHLKEPTVKQLETLSKKYFKQFGMVGSQLNVAGVKSALNSGNQSVLEGGNRQRSKSKNELVSGPSTSKDRAKIKFTEAQVKSQVASQKSKSKIDEEDPSTVSQVEQGKMENNGTTAKDHKNFNLNLIAMEEYSNLPAKATKENKNQRRIDSLHASQKSQFVHRKSEPQNLSYIDSTSNINQPIFGQHSKMQSILQSEAEDQLAIVLERDTHNTTLLKSPLSDALGDNVSNQVQQEAGALKDSNSQVKLPQPESPSEREQHFLKLYQSLLQKKLQSFNFRPILSKGLTQIKPMFELQGKAKELEDQLRLQQLEMAIGPETPNKVYANHQPPQTAEPPILELKIYEPASNMSEEQRTTKLNMFQTRNVPSNCYSREAGSENINGNKSGPYGIQVVQNKKLQIETNPEDSTSEQGQNRQGMEKLMQFELKQSTTFISSNNDQMISKLKPAKASSSLSSGLNNTLGLPEKRDSQLLTFEPNDGQPNLLQSSLLISVSEGQVEKVKPEEASSVQPVPAESRPPQDNRKNLEQIHPEFSFNHTDDKQSSFSNDYGLIGTEKQQSDVMKVLTLKKKKPQIESLLDGNLTTIQSVRDGQEIIKSLMSDHDMGNSPPTIYSGRQQIDNISTQLAQATIGSNTKERVTIRDLDKYEAILELILAYNKNKDFRQKNDHQRAASMTSERPKLNGFELKQKLLKTRVQHHWTVRRVEQFQERTGVSSLSPKRDNHFTETASVSATQKEILEIRQNRFSLPQIAMLEQIAAIRNPNVVRQVRRDAILASQDLDEYSDSNLTEKQLDDLRRIDPELRELIDRFYDLGSQIFGPSRKHLLHQRILQIFEMAIVNKESPSRRQQTLNLPHFQSSYPIETKTTSDPAVEADQQSMRMTAGFNIEEGKVDIQTEPYRNILIQSQEKPQHQDVSSSQSLHPWKKVMSNSQSHFQSQSQDNSNLYNLASSQDPSIELFLGGRKEELMEPKLRPFEIVQIKLHDKKYRRHQFNSQQKSPMLPHDHRPSTIPSSLVKSGQIIEVSSQIKAD